MKPRAVLRTETRAEHDRVDRLFSNFDLDRPDDYRRFLLAQAAAFLPAEAALDAADAATILDDWPGRRRSALIEADLAQLKETLPEQIPPPIFPSPASVMGGIYVLEGSRLGGALLKRDLPPECPRHFLDAAQQPGSWRKLLDKLDRLLYRPDDLEAAVKAAREVFQRFEAGGQRYLETRQRERSVPPC